jgi:RHS repeat-associated protein
MQHTTTISPMPQRASQALRQFSQALALCASLACAMWLPGQALADTKVRTSSFEYDARGLLAKEVVEPTSPQDCLQTSYAYDGYGNQTSVSTSACSGASGNTLVSANTPRVATNSYGADGRFPLVTSNALGQSETKAYDPRFGVTTRLVGPNSLATTWAYDNFGRKTREARTDGTYTIWAYKQCGDTGANCPGPIGGAAISWVAIEQSYAVNNAVNAPEKRQYYDMLDRVLRVQTTGYDGVQMIASNPAGAPVMQDTEYNSLGQVVRSSNTYSASSPVVWTSYTYDTLGRVLQASTLDPDAPYGINTTRYDYNGLSTTVTNTKGQTKTTLKNAQGQVAKVTDALGSTIVYGYDALGQLLATNAAGSVTKMEYNQRGQKIKMQDPSMGEWLYSYNAFGELVSQRDSLGQVVTMLYDSLGRMGTRTEVDLKSYWSYDKNFDNTACPKGIGKLCQAKTDNGYLRSHTYDPLGRISSTATVLDNPAAPVTVSVAYDPNTGRLVSKTWPTGYKASYTYTPKGYLSAVDGYGGSSDRAASYQITGMNERGQITRTAFGNGVWESIDIDASNARVRSVLAYLPSFGPRGQAPDLMSQAYTYDGLGNLITRKDNVTGVSEGFSYDSLNRLTNYNAVGGSLTAASPNNSVQVMYDVRGNINYKSDVGQYWYDSARPNRMTAVTLSTPAGGQPLTGSRALAYAFDDYRPGAVALNGTVLGNGNLMYTVSQDASQNRHTVRWEEYTSFNMPKEIKYANLVNNAAGVSTGATTVATTLSGYTCPAGSTLRGAECVSMSPAEAVCILSSGVFYPLGDHVCNTTPPGGFLNYYGGTIILYGCPLNQSLSGNTCTAFRPADAVYTCPTNYQLSGTQCKQFTNNAATGTNSTNSDRTITFVYGPEHQRIKQVVQLSANAPAALKAGEGTTWYLNGEDSLGLSYEKEVKVNGIAEHKHYLTAGGQVFALQVTRTGNLAAGSPSVPGSTQSSSLSYFHHDHLGSIAAITDENRNVVERLAYDPWGKRRYPDGASDVSDSLTGQRTDRGYTEHEHLDEMGIIHMNGRVYDPLIGRFMSADPYVQMPSNLKTFNRYAYVWNNPLKMFDPDGFNALDTTTGSFVRSPSGGSSGGGSNSPPPTQAVVAAASIAVAAPFELPSLWSILKVLWTAARLSPPGAVATTVVTGLTFSGGLNSDEQKQLDRRNAATLNVDGSKDADNNKGTNTAKGEDQKGDTPNPDLEKTPTTNPEDFDPVKGTKAKKDKESGEIWEHDQLHKDHWEVYRNKKDWEKGRRDRDIWDDGRPKRKF